MSDNVLATLDDTALLTGVVAVVEAAGEVLKSRFSAAPPRLASHEEVLAALRANDDAVLEALRGPLLAARPGSGWVEDEMEGGALPPGEWWVADPAEGNINHVHGLPDWGVTATLVRDNQPVLTVVRLPQAGTTYTAVAGGGAHQDGVPLRTSPKTSLTTALVGTGQARPDDDAEAHRRIGESAVAMMRGGVVLRVSVPASLHLVQVAAGRMEAYWQHDDVRSDHTAGALLVSEAGGVVTDVRGMPWRVGSASLLAAAPGVHADAVDLLSVVR
jgi:myo-inositol-1(or 4)-monophosphatase